MQSHHHTDVSPSRLEWVLMALIWWLFLAMVQVDWTVPWFEPDLRPNRPAPLSALFLPLVFLLHTYWLIPHYVRTRQWGRYALSLIALCVLPELIRAAMYSNGSAATFRQALVGRDSLLFATLSPVTPALLLSFAYRFTRDWWRYQRRIEQLETQRLRQEVQALKAQIDPHFLFNNLQALDELISSDREDARTYLSALSNTCRYLIQSANRELVLWSEEWTFVQDYLHLLEVRFGDVYQFDVAGDPRSVTDSMIPPTSLQQLVENAVKHNQGLPGQPLRVTIRIEPHQVAVSNQLRPRVSVRTSLGTGLELLRSRYRLLSDRPVETSQDETTFRVTIPLLEKPKA
jgi:two-component system, LytTR family, sensor kinase